MPNASLTIFRKGMLSGTKLYCALLPNMTIMNYNTKVLKPELKDYLSAHAFCSVEFFLKCAHYWVISYNSFITQFLVCMLWFKNGY